MVLLYELLQRHPRRWLAGEIASGTHRARCGRGGRDRVVAEHLLEYSGQHDAAAVFPCGLSGVEALAADPISVSAAPLAADTPLDAARTVRSLSELPSADQRVSDSARGGRANPACRDAEEI